MNRIDPLAESTQIGSSVRFAEWRGDLRAPYRVLPDLRRRWKALHWGRKAGIGAAVAIYAASFFVKEPITFIGFINVSGCVAFLKRKANPNLADLVPSPLPPDHFPVRLELACKGEPYGEDEGMVTFVDGWLLFEGTRCSFSVRSGDAKVVRRPAYNERLDKECEAMPEDELKLVLGDIAARLVPFPSMRLPDRTLEDVGYRFMGRVRVWVHEANPEGTPVLPPALAHPEVLGWQGVQAAWAGVFLSLLTAPLLVCYLRNPSDWGIAIWCCPLLFALSILCPIGARKGQDRLLRDLAAYRDKAARGLRTPQT